MFPKYLGIVVLCSLLTLGQVQAEVHKNNAFRRVLAHKDHLSSGEYDILGEGSYSDVFENIEHEGFIREAGDSEEFARESSLEEEVTLSEHPSFEEEFHSTEPFESTFSNESLDFGICEGENCQFSEDTTIIAEENDLFAEEISQENEHAEEFDIELSYTEEEEELSVRLQGNNQEETSYERLVEAENDHRFELEYQTQIDCEEEEECDIEISSQEETTKSQDLLFEDNYQNTNSAEKTIEVEFDFEEEDESFSGSAEFSREEASDLDKSEKLKKESDLSIQRTKELHCEEEECSEEISFSDCDDGNCELYENTKIDYDDNFFYSDKDEGSESFKNTYDVAAEYEAEEESFSIEAEGFIQESTEWEQNYETESTNHLDLEYTNDIDCTGDCEEYQRSFEMHYETTEDTAWNDMYSNERSQENEASGEFETEELSGSFDIKTSSSEDTFLNTTKESSSFYSIKTDLEAECEDCDGSYSEEEYSCEEEYYCYSCEEEEHSYSEEEYYCYSCEEEEHSYSEEEYYCYSCEEEEYSYSEEEYYCYSCEEEEYSYDCDDCESEFSQEIALDKDEFLREEYQNVHESSFDYKADLSYEEEEDYINIDAQGWGIQETDEGYILEEQKNLEFFSDNQYSEDCEGCEGEFEKALDYSESNFKKDWYKHNNEQEHEIGVEFQYEEIEGEFSVSLGKSEKINYENTESDSLEFSLETSGDIDGCDECGDIDGLDEGASELSDYIGGSDNIIGDESNFLDTDKEIYDSAVIAVVSTAVLATLM